MITSTAPIEYLTMAVLLFCVAIQILLFGYFFNSIKKTKDYKSPEMLFIVLTLFLLTFDVAYTYNKCNEDSQNTESVIK